MVFFNPIQSRVAQELIHYTESIFIDENYITNTLESFIAFQLLVHSRIRGNISSMYVGIVLSTSNL